jgi:two-component system chemotaxis response regulator CheY
MAISILIVDDSAATRQVIERVARLSDPNVGTCHHAGNGNEALKVLQEQWIDLVFADIHMPGMDGRELLKRIRENNLWAKIPVAIITSEQSDDTEVELVDLGANFYHKKPLTPESLKEVFNSLKEMMP